MSNGCPRNVKLPMLAKRAVVNALLKKNGPLSITNATYSTGGFHDERLPIGKREWVCYGINGLPHYVDRVDFPMPAVKFQEMTPEIAALREKEKGDWKNLTIEEKKKLYRASFCQTLVEAEAPTGVWKSILGLTLATISVGFGLMYIHQVYFYRPKPPTFSDEHRAATLRKMIDLKMGHLYGVASKWDYEKDEWKK